MLLFRTAGSLLSGFSWSNTSYHRSSVGKSRCGGLWSYCRVVEVGGQATEHRRSINICREVSNHDHSIRELSFSFWSDTVFVGSNSRGPLRESRLDLQGIFPF